MMDATNHHAKGRSDMIPASVPAHLAAKGWHTPKERNYQMPIQPVALDTLPVRTRALSDVNMELANAIAAVLATGAGASDGEPYPDRKAATKVGDHARRAFLRSKLPIPAGMTVRARYDETVLTAKDGDAAASEWRWTVYLTAKTEAKK